MKKNVKNKILVSIIVPIFNVEKYIEKCVLSLINQTYKNIQIILIDDHSTDKSGEICDNFAKKDDRILLIHNSKNIGLGGARNIGLKNALGDYIQFVDSDDYLKLNSIEEEIKKINETNVDAVLFGVNCIDENGNFIKKCAELPQKKYLNKYSYWKFYTSSLVTDKLYKKNIFENIKFVEGKLHEDLFIIHKIIEKCKIISVLDIYLYNYVQRIDSITHTNDTKRIFNFLEALVIRLEYFKSNKNYNEIFKENFLVALDSLILLSNKKLSNYEKQQIRFYFKKFNTISNNFPLNNVSFKTKIKIKLLKNVYLFCFLIKVSHLINKILLLKK